MANSNQKSGSRPQMGQAGWILLLIIATVMTLLPLIFTLSLSFRTQNSIYDPRLFVTELTNGNYIKAMKDNPTIPYNFLASFVISTVSTVATVLFASMAVFGFSRENVKGKLLMYNMIMCALMVPISALVIPITQLNSRFGLLDNYFGLIFPYIALNIPYAVTILRGLCREFQRSWRRRPSSTAVPRRDCMCGSCCRC